MALFRCLGEKQEKFFSVLLETGPLRPIGRNPCGSNAFPFAVRKNSFNSDCVGKAVSVPGLEVTQCRLHNHLPEMMFKGVSPWEFGWVSGSETRLLLRGTSFHVHMQSGWVSPGQGAKCVF